MKNFLLKAVYGALGTIIVAIGQALIGTQSNPSDVAVSAGLIGAATGVVAQAKRAWLPGKPAQK